MNFFFIYIDMWTEKWQFSVNFWQKFSVKKNNGFLNSSPDLDIQTRSSP